MTGISHSVYWLPHVAFDFIFCMVMLLPMFITVNVQYIVYSDSFTSSLYFLLMQLWLIVNLSLYCSISTYLFSVLWRNFQKAYMFMLFYQVVQYTVVPSIILIISTIIQAIVDLISGGYVGDDELILY